MSFRALPVINVLLLAPLGAAADDGIASYSIEGKVVVEVEAPEPHAQPQPAAEVSGNQIHTLERVYFESRGASVRPQSFPALDAIAALLLATPSIQHVRVEAHTDSAVSSNNLLLSQRRADWVRGYLLKKGISADRVSAKGFGEAQPVASNDTADGRAQNRRVEFVIIE